jgi:hypothetical protein
MFTRLYLWMRTLPQELRDGWQKNRLWFWQMITFITGLVVLAFNRFVVQNDTLDLIVVVAMPWLAAIAVALRLSLKKFPPLKHRFEATVFFPIKMALWFQVVGSFLILWRETQLGPDAFDELFLLLFIVPIEWALTRLYYHRLTPLPVIKLLFVALLLGIVSFLFFTLSITA